MVVNKLIPKHHEGGEADYDSHIHRVAVNHGRKDRTALCLMDLVLGVCVHDCGAGDRAPGLITFDKTPP